MNAYLLAGLSLGDEGKGRVTDALVRKTNARAVVRYNGGAQAAHNVVRHDGKSHCFSQFGAGTFAGAETVLSRYMLIEPLALRNEALHLSDLGFKQPYDLLTVDSGCPLITPYHMELNRRREDKRAGRRHGSCGMGIGETMSDVLRFPDRVLRVGDLAHSTLVREKLFTLRDRLIYENAHLVNVGDLFHNDKRVDELVAAYLNIFAKIRVRDGDWFERFRGNASLVFEGAQGVLLDQDYGFHPHTTWSDCTFTNAVTLMREADPSATIERIGVTRAYTTRHGVGPFPTYNDRWTVGLPDAHNGQHQWQGSFRVGPFDEVLARYALKVIGPLDGIAVTNMDRLRTFGDYVIGEAYGLKDAAELQEHLSKPKPLNGRMTELLATAQPLYRDAGNAERVLDVIRRAYDAPIRLTTSGVTADSEAWQPVPVFA